MSSSKEAKYILEQRLWFVGVGAGLLIAAWASSAFFAYWGLIALGFATDIDQMGVSGVGATLLVSAIITKVLAGKLWDHAIVVFVSMGSRFGHFFQHIGELDEDNAEEFCHEGNLLFILIGLIVGVTLLSFFHLMSWTCETANPAGGLAYGTCEQYEPGPYRSLVLAVVRLMGGAFGVAGLSFLFAGLLELRFLWRGSRAQHRYRSSSLYFWLHPRAAFRQDLEQSDQEENG